MGIEHATWKPGWTVSPGEILAEALQARGMSQSELARRMDRPVKTINEIVKGKAAITPDTAIQLERSLGISARVWNGLESRHREWLAFERADAELAEHVQWAAAFPLRDLVRHRLIPEGQSGTDRVAALLSYFRVGTPTAWDRQWLEPATSFRASPSYASSPQAVAAWLRWGEIEAEGAEIGAFDAPRFRSALQAVRPLTRREPFLQIVERVKELCAEAGVAVVLTPELTGTHLSGAARWRPGGGALIQLSLRHKTDDHFWFTLFHEGGHLLEGKRRDYIDAVDDPSAPNAADEAEADTFARDTLLPRADYETFVQGGDFNEASVRSFAESQTVSAGIVVGRLQRDGWLDRTHLNKLKRSIRWPAAQD